jgi:hypothetical protein
MRYNRLTRLIKTTPQKAKGTKEDHWRDFWMFGTEQVNKWRNDDDDIKEKISTFVLSSCCPMFYKFPTTKSQISNEQF